MRESKAKTSLIEAHSLHFKIKLDLKNAKLKIYFSEESSAAPEIIRGVLASSIKIESTSSTMA